MNLEQIEKFVLNAVNEEMRPSVKQCFVNFKTMPEAEFQAVWNGGQDGIRNETVHAHSYYQGLLSGVFICMGSEKSAHISKMLDDFIALKVKIRGENVIDFARRVGGHACNHTPGA